ncbi:hypothetical protein KW797_02910 [Candidatus Parcubacteria bacterium]|nr:hypothetical protein [Candidatus Parcubacteria bacterium]
MDLPIGTFYGLTVSLGMVATGVTQVLKVSEQLPPSLAKIPVVGPFLAWFVDTITPEDPGAIQIFVLALCFGLNELAFWKLTGHMQIDFLATVTTLSSFVHAMGGYHVFIDKKTGWLAPFFYALEGVPEDLPPE